MLAVPAILWAGNGVAGPAAGPAHESAAALPAAPAGTGIVWPEGQALPAFAEPADVLDAIDVGDLTTDEQLTFSALQGIVNRSRPRILLVDSRAGEGRDTWAETLGLRTGRTFGRTDKWRMVEKYAAEVAGLVLYDPGQSPHYRNLAGTVAGLRNVLPVTGDVLDRMRRNGVDLPVAADLTGLTLATPAEVYGYLYDTWWSGCTRRLLLSAKPHDDGGRGDYHHTRDMAAACGAAIVWLDNRIPEERQVMRRFLADMTPGAAVVLGWYSTERSGITTASEFGIGTLPADHYVSATVFSGARREVRIPPVPRMPRLGNRAYVAAFISDGDNIQYMQHAMRRLWDGSTGVRGTVALNWTVAPGLVDIGPGILNYYYSTATSSDCFVSGPSGMGYMMPVNTLEEPGAPVGPSPMPGPAMEAYSRLTESYLQRAGIRVVTIWDDATPEQRAAYARHCRSLWGATVQNFHDVPEVASSVVDGRVRFEKLSIPYAGTQEHAARVLTRAMRRWDGTAPLFLAFQAAVWNDLKPDRIAALRDQLAAGFPGRVEFVRADHWFSLYNQAHGLPFNLALLPGAGLTEEPSGAPAAAAADGSRTTLWKPSAGGTAVLRFDAGASFSIHRCVIRFADDGEPPAGLSRQSVRIEAGDDGQEWRTAVTISDNGGTFTDVEFAPVRARYLRFILDSPAAGGISVADIEIYGRQ